MSLGNVAEIIAGKANRELMNRQLTIDEKCHVYLGCYILFREMYKKKELSKYKFFHIADILFATYEKEVLKGR